MAKAASQPILVLEFKPELHVIQKDLKDLGADIRSFKEPLKRCIQQVVIPSIRANFDAGGRPTWAPYAASTIEFHEMLGTDLSPSMLVKSGALKRTATQLNIWTITKDQAKFSGLPANVWYGNLHQTGGKGGKGPRGIIPARPFIMFQDEDGDKITQVFAKWLDERIAKQWGGK
jgi:phage gpG-like protein